MKTLEEACRTTQQTIGPAFERYNALYVEARKLPIVNALIAHLMKRNEPGEKLFMAAFLTGMTVGIEMEKD